MSKIVNCFTCIHGRIENRIRLYRPGKVRIGPKFARLIKDYDIYQPEEDVCVPYLNTIIKQRNVSARTSLSLPDIGPSLQSLTCLSVEDFVDFDAIIKIRLSNGQLVFAGEESLDEVLSYNSTVTPNLPATLLGMGGIAYLDAIEYNLARYGMEAVLGLRIDQPVNVWFYPDINIGSKRPKRVQYTLSNKDKLITQTFMYG